MNSADTKKIAIMGASGYGGVEFLRLCAGHPGLEVTYIGGHSSAGEKIGNLYPHLPAPVADMVLGGLDVNKAAEVADVLVFCLPHSAGMDMVAEAYSMGKIVADFSADYRLKDVAEYEAYYEVKHTHPELLDVAVYGLPELHREELKQTKLIAVPGCYPTSIILGMAPAMKAGFATTDLLIADSASGVSGAGRKASLGTHYSEVNESYKAYKVASHRHTPEMDQELGGLAPVDGDKLKTTFVPHLAPMIRGILSTCYSYLKEGVTLEEVHAAYADFYANEPFVTVLPLGKLPATKNITNTNRDEIGLAMDERSGKLIVVSAVDNLIKGLAGAAVQSINVVCGWDETTGLPLISNWP